MTLDLRATLPAVVVTAACLVAVTARLLVAPAPSPRRAATAAERVELAELVAKSERGWMQEATRDFPEDHWSQRDDFHGRELRQAVQAAKDKGVRVEDVLRAVDDDIHRRRAPGHSAPDDRYARAVPCKPRPFYD